MAEVDMIKRISNSSARSTDQGDGSALAEKARDAVSACRSGGRGWVVTHPGMSLMLALCGGATLGWLIKRR